MHCLDCQWQGTTALLMSSWLWKTPELSYLCQVIFIVASGSLNNIWQLSSRDLSHASRLPMKDDAFEEIRGDTEIALRGKEKAEMKSSVQRERRKAWISSPPPLKYSKRNPSRDLCSIEQHFQDLSEKSYQNQWSFHEEKAPEIFHTNSLQSRCDRKCSVYRMGPFLRWLGTRVLGSQSYASSCAFRLDFS